MTDDGKPIPDSASSLPSQLLSDRPQTDVLLGSPAALPAVTRRAGSLGVERYRMLDRIGKGGMGEVFAARDEVLGREIAIKRMLDPSPSAQTLDRFLREARIQGALDHPAIPPVHELAEDDRGRPYFVMKRLVGTTLSNILAGLAIANLRAEYPRERLLRAFAEVCLAVEFAHIRGVIHRDLKPSNIMLGDFGEVYVLDWGVAKVAASVDPELLDLHDPAPLDGAVDTTYAGTIIGTLGYMAPEQRAAQAIDARADVYSLGCVLFDILIDGNAKPDMTPGERPSSRGASVPPELDELCASATAADLGRRIPTARELGATVQRYLDGDRDLALRQDLARDHLARARVAMTGDLAAQQRAMQEAGSALALDPTLPGAAELVGRLMLEPPQTTPVELEDEIEKARWLAIRRTAKHGGLAYLVWAVMIPFMWWIGVLEPNYLVALVIIVAILGALAWRSTRPDPNHRFTWLTIVGSGALVFVCARMFSPFLLAPEIAAVTALVMISSPAFRSRRTVIAIAVIMCAAIVCPFVAESAGWLSPTMELAGDQVRGVILTIEPHVLQPHAFAIPIGLAVFAPGMVITAVVIGIGLVRSEDATQRKLRIQGWWLRQLVPVDTKPQ